jgi:hypothetical protein
MEPARSDMNRLFAELAQHLATAADLRNLLRNGADPMGTRSSTVVFESLVRRPMALWRLRNHKTSIQWQQAPAPTAQDVEESLALLDEALQAALAHGHEPHAVARALRTAVAVAAASEHSMDLAKHLLPAARRLGSLPLSAPIAGSDLLQMADRLSSELAWRGPDSPVIASFVSAVRVDEQARELLREMRGAPYAFVSSPALFIYLAFGLRCFDASLYQSEERAQRPRPHVGAEVWPWADEAERAVQDWLCRRSTHVWPLPSQLSHRQLRLLLRDLPEATDPAASLAAATALVRWAVGIGSAMMLPLVLCLLPGIGADAVAAAVTDFAALGVPSVEEVYGVRAEAVGEIAACLHWGHRRLLSPSARRSFVQRRLLNAKGTTRLLRCGMMDGWDRHPLLGAWARDVGFSPVIAPLVWFSRLSEDEWLLAVHAALGGPSKLPVGTPLPTWLALRGALGAALGRPAGYRHDLGFAEPAAELRRAPPQGQVSGRPGRGSRSGCDRSEPEYGALGRLPLRPALLLLDFACPELAQCVRWE